MNATHKQAVKTGWVAVGQSDGKTLYSYAETNKYNTSKLSVKTYANKTQAHKMAEQLSVVGTSKCWVRLGYPFVIYSTNPTP